MRQAQFSVLRVAQINSQLKIFNHRALNTREGVHWSHLLCDLCNTFASFAVTSSRQRAQHSCSPFAEYPVVVHCSRAVSQREALCSALSCRYRRIVSTGGLVWLQDGLPGIARFLNRLRPTLPTDDHDWGIHKAVSNDHHRTRADFRNAHSRVLPRSDAGGYGAMDVAQSAVFHTCHFCSCSNRHTYHRHFEYVPFCCTDGRALRNEHRSGLAGEPLTDAEDVMSPIMILLDVKLRKCGRHSGRIYNQRQLRRGATTSVGTE